jgi:hypothetical protein
VVPLRLALGFTVIGLLVAAGAAPITGRLSDRIGHVAGARVYGVLALIALTAAVTADETAFDRLNLATSERPRRTVPVACGRPPRVSHAAPLQATGSAST